MVDTAFLEILASQSEIEVGIRPEFVIAGSKKYVPMTNVPILERKGHETMRWTEEEDSFLKENLGWISEEEIAKRLGRTLTAVHLRWKRDLFLAAPSKNPNYVSADKAAKILNVDTHKVAHWCDAGLIPYRILPGGRKIRLIPIVSFRRWVVSTSNWIYFDWKKIKDPHLKRLCELKAKRWGDEWWSTPKAAKYHGVISKDVIRLVRRGEIVGIQIETSLGGRHKDLAWKTWFVLKSSAMSATFVRGKGNARWTTFTDRAIAWMLKANAMGLNYAEIARSMGSKHTSTTIAKAIERAKSKTKKLKFSDSRQLSS